MVFGKEEMIRRKAMTFYPYENQVDPAAVGMDKDKLDKVVSRF